jgi:drug/metabolite transporter (DMT)-like permease
MFLAVAAFSLMDAMLKVFAGQYPPMQVTAIRGLASLPFIVGPLLVSGRLAELRPTNLPLHLLRAGLGVVMLATFVAALRTGSLSSVYSIYMSAPLLIVVLAALLLGEQVDRGRWIAILVGLAGVLVILQPTADGVSLRVGLIAAVSALCYALAVIVARRLTRTDTSASIVFVFLALVALVSGVIAAPDWRPILASHWLAIVAIGLFGAIGQHAITEAFRHAPASTVAPIEYTALLWGLGIDWVAWQTSPALHMLAGAVLVSAAGIYVARRARAEA